ncbi:Glycosyl hydrolase, five-bladed beta-propellor domain containing protein [Rhypophila decipiens]
MFLVSLTVTTLFAVAFGDTGAPTYLRDLRTSSEIGNPFVGVTWQYPGCATDTANGWSVWVFAVDKPHDSNGTSLSITAFSSPETHNWYIHEKVIDMSGFGGANASLYSPTPVFRKDKYYLYFSATGYPPDTPPNEQTVGNYSGIWVGVADKPEGPYKNPLPNNTALIPAEDPTITEPRGPAILVDKDRTYLFYGPGGSLAFVELDDDMITLKNESKTLTMPPGNYGGIKVFKRSEMYYIVWNDVQLARPGVPERPSSIRYAMSVDLDGPFYGGDAVLAGDPFVARSVYHADILEVMDDVWYIFYARSQSNPDVSDAVVEGLAWEQVKFGQNDKSIIPVPMGVQSQWSSDYNWTNPYKLPVGVLPHDANAKFSAGKSIRSNSEYVDRYVELDAAGTQSAVHGMMLVGFEDFQLDIGIYFEQKSPDDISGSAGIIFGGRKDDKNVEGWTGHILQVSPQGDFSLNRMDQNGGEVKKLVDDVAAGDTALITIKTEGNRTRVFLGGEISPEYKIMEYDDSQYHPGWIGFRAWGLKARYGGLKLQKVREPDFAVASSQIPDKETEEPGKPKPSGK